MRSASRSFRMICSGVCIRPLKLVAPAPGRFRTLMSRGPVPGGQASAEVERLGLTQLAAAEGDLAWVIRPAYLLLVSTTARSSSGVGQGCLR
jgi:hypothetical protein